MAGSTMTNSFYTKNDSVVHELFRAIERYDMKYFLKAASDSNPRVISDEEMHQLTDHQSKQRICEELKKLILGKGRLKNFSHFTLSYSGHVPKAALATLQLMGDSQLPVWNTNAECSTHSEGDPLPGPIRGLIQQQHKSRSSSGSTTPPSPMEVDSKDADVSSLVLAQEATDIGYATATYTDTGPSSKDGSQGQISSAKSQHLWIPPSQAGNILLPLHMVKKKKAHPTECDTYTYEHLSQPTFEEHQTAYAWPPMQDHGYAHHMYSDCLSQDSSQDQISSRYLRQQLDTCAKPPDSGPLQTQFTDNEREAQCTTDGWLPQLIQDNYEVFLQNLNLEALHPHLIKNGLLTQSEYQELDYRKELRRTQNQYFLLTVLPGKGKAAFNVFLECLKEEKGHLGHQDIIKTIYNKKR